MYDTVKPKRPTKLSEESKLLKDEINQICETSNTVEFIGVFPSLKHRDSAENIYDSGKFLIRRFDLLLNQLISSYDKYYEVQRIPATEAVVFLCCDLDRKWGKDTAHSVPVCWFPKGYSLDTITMRNILEPVLDTCKQAKIHVPAISFDGQWHNIAVRDVNEKPLTMLQLQKDVWKRVEKMPKRDILKSIFEMNKDVTTHIDTSFTDTGSVIRSFSCTNGGVLLPKISSSVVSQRLKWRKQSFDGNHIEQLEMTDKVCGEDEEEQIVGDGEPCLNKMSETHDDVVNNEDTECEKHEKTTDSVVEKHQNEQFICLSDNDKAAILTQFKLDKHSNAKNQWDCKSVHDMHALFQSGQSLRQLRDAELRIVV